MKVLIVFNHPAPYKVRLFNELSKEIDLDVIFERKSASDRPKDFYNCNKYNFNAMFLKKGSFSKENSNTNELKKYIAQNYKKYNLIIMNGYSTITEIKAIRYMIKNHIPYSIYVNGGVIRKEGYFKKAFKTHLIKHAFHYFSPCKEANDYLTYYGARINDISTYIYSTVYEKDILDKPLSSKDKDILRVKFNLPKGKIFVTAGQFIPRKNNTQLLTNFVCRNETLLIIGEGPEKNLYQSIVKENNMQNVIFRDFLKKDELLKILKCCNCFITLSKEDIFGHTTNEALSCGLPVISSNKVVASQHLIKDGENGFLVDLENDSSIQRALNSITEEMSIKAIETAKQNTIEESAKIHIKIIKELVK